MSSIYKQDQAYFEELREYAIAYVQYVNNGGTISRYTDVLIDKTIDVVMKLKANRDYVNELCGKEVPKYDKDGNRKQTKVRSRVSAKELQTGQAIA